MHFHRRRIFVATSFIGVYTFLCKKGVTFENEILRMGVAGSLANVIVETGFHFVDTVNVRLKVNEQSISSLKMVR